MASDVAQADQRLGSLGINVQKLGMWIFLASEVMFFTGLIGSYIVLRFANPTWPQPGEILNVPLTAFNTFVLICSSVTMVKAYAALTSGDQKGLKKYLLATTLIGALFLFIQAYEYQKLFQHGLTLTSSIYGSCFYILTGFHGAHVAIGVMCLAFTTIKAFRGRYQTSYVYGVEIVGLYWHFVDLVWIMLFTIVYLI
jgi:heme/copper-type cytochrome/quinol oxidase subunit 3